MESYNLGDIVKFKLDNADCKSKIFAVYNNSPTRLYAVEVEGDHFSHVKVDEELVKNWQSFTCYDVDLAIIGRRVYWTSWHSIIGLSD